MAIDAYMFFKKPNNGGYLAGESQVKMDFETGDLASPFKAAGTGNLFEIEDYSFGIEQTINMSSQSSGTGAGKVTFNPFSITRKIDKASPLMFEAACSGTAFEQVGLGLRKAGGTGNSGLFFLNYIFKLVAVKTIDWAHADESPSETITFEYGALQIRYAPQKPDGTLDTPVPGGWNKIRNVQDRDMKSAI